MWYLSAGAYRNKNFTVCTVKVGRNWSYPLLFYSPALRYCVSTMHHGNQDAIDVLTQLKWGVLGNDLSVEMVTLERRICPNSDTKC